MDFYLADFRQSWRTFRRAPGLALTATAALAMGIGFTTTMFSIVHGGTRPLPFDKPDELVLLTGTDTRSGAADVTPWEYEYRRWRTGLTSYEGVAAYRDYSLNLSGGDAEPVRISVAETTPNLLELLGVTTERGRPLEASDAEPGAAPVAVISHALWRTRLGGAQDVVGQRLRMRDQEYTVIGVMPEGFGFPLHARAWLPLIEQSGSAAAEGDRVRIFGRLKDGVTTTAASAELALDAARLAEDFPATHAERSARVFPFTDVETPPDVRRGLQFLVLAVSLTLLVACANVANLLLARAAARSRDTAIRSALGASRGRLIAQQLYEALILAGLAAALSLGMASVGLRVFEAASSEILEAFWVDFRIDAAVLACATLLGAVAAAAAGLAPALRATRVDVSATLQNQAGAVAGPRIGRLGRWLVTAQIALACGLLIVTATLVRTSGELRMVPIPFAADEILTAQVTVDSAVFENPEAHVRLLRDLDRVLNATPDFERAALVNVFPGRGTGPWQVRLDGDEAPRRTERMSVTPSFFALAERPLLQGRVFNETDDADAARVVVVNESFVRKNFPEEDPVGRRLFLGDEETTIVGVVRDLMIQDIEDVDGAGIYVSMLQYPSFTTRVMARSMAAPLTAADALRRATDRVDPDLPLIEIASLRDAIYADKKILDMFALLFLCFGAGTVFLALSGLYAVMSFVVTQRVREFGVRRAIGATNRDIFAAALRHGVRELAWGLVVGLALAAALSRALSSSIERLPPAGVGVFGAIAAVVLLGAAAALWRPLLRAVRLEPVEALRAD